MALGVELGDKLKPPTEKNPTGFFEDQELLAIAKQVRGALHLRTESVSLIEPAQWTAPGLEALREAAVEIIHRRFARYPIWGFKYAQTLRMLPFWEDVAQRAEIDLSFLLAVRNPLSVARSRSKLDPLRGLQEKSDIEWLVNVVPYFRRLAAHPFAVVDYDLLMAEPRQQLERIAARLSIPLDSGAQQGVREYAASFLKAGMRHTQFTDADLAGDVRLNGLTRDGYRWLQRLATDALASDDPGLWRDWSRIEEQLMTLGPVLRHIDYLEAEVRRGRGGTIRGTIAKLLRRR
jgi:hypothetical protein